MPNQSSNTSVPHSRDIRLPSQSHSPEVQQPRSGVGPEVQQPRSGVGQDKTAPRHDRIASPQPAPPMHLVRSHQMQTTSTRSQKRSSKRQTVSVTLWVRPSLKAELDRLADAEGLSISKIGGTFLEEAVRQKLHVQHAVLLQPIIEQAIRKQMRGISTRLAWLLVRVAFDAGQTRSLVTNILSRQPGIAPAVLKHILDGSSKSAKGNITRRTPQMVDLIEAVEQWIVTEEGEMQPHE